MDSVDRVLLQTVTAGEWPVELVETEGLWETRAVQTFLFLPSFLGPAATLLLHRLAYTYPTGWTTGDLAHQLGLSKQRTVESLGRAAEFDLIIIASTGIEVPTRLGPLPPKQLNRLHPRLRQVHNRLLDPGPP
jgi:hypothetical protein